MTKDLYTATYVILENKKIISSIREVQEINTLRDDEVQLSKEIYNHIQKNITKTGFQITTDNKYIETQEQIEDTELINTNTSSIDYMKINVGLFIDNEYSNRRFITGISTIQIRDYNPNTQLLLDSDVYFILSNSRFELTNCIYYIENKDTHRVTIKDLKLINTITGNTAEQDNIENSIINARSSVMNDAGIDSIKDITNENYINLYKQNVRNKALFLLQNKIDSVMMLSFANMLITNNELVGRGFVITEENREDKYLEIINHDDPKLLDILSQYLESIDAISPYLFYYKQYVKLVSELEYTENVEETDSVWHTYLKLFFKEYDESEQNEAIDSIEK